GLPGKLVASGRACPTTTCAQPAFECLRPDGRALRNKILPGPALARAARILSHLPTHLAARVARVLQGVASNRAAREPARRDRVPRPELRLRRSRSLPEFHHGSWRKPATRSPSLPA